MDIKIQQTPYNTLRVFVNKKELAETERRIFYQGQLQFTTNRDISMTQYILDSLSIWGGSDAEDETYKSWEFDKTLESGLYDLIKRALIMPK